MSISKQMSDGDRAVWDEMQADAVPTADEQSMSNEQRTVERFDALGDNCVEVSAKGEFVYYAEYERLEKTLDALVPSWRGMDTDGRDYEQAAIHLLQREVDDLKAALSSLYQALRVRHHGRMPDEVQTAYDAAGAVLSAQVKINS